MQFYKKKDFIFLLFPKLRLVKCTFDAAKTCYKINKALKNKKKMQLPIKVGLISGGIFLFIIIFGFISFPLILKGQVKKMVKLTPGTEIRGMFSKIPFPLDFKVYLFNVTNAADVDNGAKPNLQEVGPFCYEEWKDKISIADDEEKDLMMYNPRDIFIKKTAEGCLSGNELITMPHPLILGIVNAVFRTKPGSIGIVKKGLDFILNKPTSVYLTAPANNILFDGLPLDCGQKDFSAKALCTQLKANGLKPLSGDILGFSLMGSKNGTEGKRFKVFRGKKDYSKVGWIVEYDGKKEMDVWSTKDCNQFRGTDGTIFPPFLKKEQGLLSFAPDLCRSLGAVYQKKTKYDGIPVNLYTASLGDMSKNPGEKCFCPTPDTCLKRGLMDLFPCIGMPIIASLPHFYDCDESYLVGVSGLNPSVEKHGIKILFEPTTGSPVSARKRLQFNMEMKPNDKMDMFKKLPTLIHPLFWVEEGVDLNNTFTAPLKSFFMIKKVVKVSKWLILLGSIGGLGAAGYLFYNKKGSADITPVRKVVPNGESADKNGTNGVNGNQHLGGVVNHAMSDNEIDKY